ncbi:hypothetical protein [Intestinirhabdus alba]|nr:hypothetical protein [Intestinirhabdus alba]
MVIINSRYRHPAAAGITFTEPTLTQQHFAQETDINQIVRRAINTGDVSVFTPADRSEFYDCTVYEDYQSSLHFLKEIEDDFSSLPSDIRRQFNDRADNYVRFMTDPANVGKAVELGLLQGGEKSKPQASASDPSDPAGAPPEAKKPESDA